jgi:O-antigen ligase
LLLVLAGVVLVPVSVRALAARPMASMAILFVAVAMPHWHVDFSSLKARPEHLVCGLLLFALPYWIKRRKQPLVWMTADYLLLAYVVMNFFSSIFMSIAPQQTIKWCLQQAIVVLPYLLLRVLITDITSFRRIFNIALVMGAAEAMFAILCFYSNLFFGTELGMEIGQYGNIPGTYGTQYEANLLGSYCGAASVMFLTMYLQRRKRIFLFGFALTVAGMGISLSRGALLATVIALSAVCLRGMQLHLFNKKLLARVALAVMCVCIVIGPALYGLWSERFSTVDISDVSADDDTNVRMLTLGLAADGIMEHPILGSGTSSYQLQFSVADVGGGDESGWISNTEIRVLYDTGLVGLVLFTAFLGYLLAGMRKQIKREPIAELEALAVSGLVYCVSFQFTEGTLLAFTWVHLGLLAAGLAVFQGVRNTENTGLQLS